MDVSQAQILIAQVRHAHRLIEGFYERILPQLDKLASEAADARFCYWGNAEGDGVGRATSKPSARAPWSFLPLFRSYYCYQRGRGAEHAQKGDIALYFRLNIDDAFNEAAPEATDYDPHTGSSSLEVHLYRFTKDALYRWDAIEGDPPWANHDTWASQAQEYPEVECSSKRVALEIAITAPSQLHDWISNQLAIVSR